MSTHHLQLFAEDGEIRPRLTCTATPDALCRRRPVDVDPDQESWTDEDETTPGHECWAVEWIEDAGLDTVTAADGILSSVDVEVTYEDGPIISLASPQPTLPGLADPTDAEVQAAARVIWYWYVGGIFGFGKPNYAYDTEKARDAARAALVAARKVARHE